MQNAAVLDCAVLQLYELKNDLCFYGDTNAQIFLAKLENMVRELMSCIRSLTQIADAVSN